MLAVKHPHDAVRAGTKQPRQSVEQGFAFLIALGAVLRFAVCISTLGFNLHTIGPILLIVGIVGLVVSVLLMTMWSDRRRGVATDNRRDGTVVRDPDLP